MCISSVDSPMTGVFEMYSRNSTGFKMCHYSVYLDVHVHRKL